MKLRASIKNIFGRLGRLSQTMIREGKGQSLIVIVFAFLGLLAFVGLAVDLGLVYAERVRIGRACDAAALAAVRELPQEYTAAQRALEYLNLNGYDITKARVEIYYCNYSPYVVPGSPSPQDAQTIIKIDTRTYEDPAGQCDTANRIKVEGFQRVGMNFMQFFGFNEVTVSGDAVAENVRNLDISIVFDRSGSMEFDTLCYGCWLPISGSEYPIGTRPYLTFPHDYTQYDPVTGPWPPPGGICSNTVYYEEDGYKYIVIEAEHYSYNSSIWDRDYVMRGYARWTMQRNTQNLYHSTSVGSSSLDSYGGYMKVMPFYYSTYEEGATDLSGAHGITATTPYLEYDFHTPSGAGGGSGPYYIYLRAQGGRNPWIDPVDVDPRVVHWGLAGGTYDGSPLGSVSATSYGAAYDGAVNSGWNDLSEWSKIGPVDLTGDHDYTLKLWAGGLGFALDKIIITRDPECNTNSGHACAKNSNKGPAQTQGRTRDACNPCDPRYGQRIEAGVVGCAPEGCDNTGDDLWDDEQPVRAAKEAVKRFVERLDPALDQIAYVYYSTADSHTDIGSQLYCQRKLGSNCKDFDQVLDAIDATFSEGSTSIGDGMRLGIYTLQTGSCTGSNPGKPCGRAGAAHIMILMTDGVANDWFTSCSSSYEAEYGKCYDSARNSYGQAAFDALWPPSSNATDEDKAKDYVIYQAMRARDNGIIIYTISLGVTADFEIMQEVADMTKGEHFYAPDTDALDHIFNTIFDRIFLRLIK